MSASNILVDPGTTALATAVALDSIGGTAYQIIKVDVGALGASVPWTGNLNPLPLTNTISNVGVVGTTAAGTLIGTSTIGVGTGVYITAYEVTVISGTPEICLSFGTQLTGNQVITHGLYVASAGVTKAKIYPTSYGTTQSPLTYQIVSGSGTVSWTVDYFLHT